MVDVAFERVHLPEGAIRIESPELRLLCIATLHAFLALGMNACSLQAFLSGNQTAGVRHAEAEMVERARSRASVWFQRHDQRWIVRLKLRVVGAEFGGL